MSDISKLLAEVEELLSFGSPVKKGKAFESVYAQPYRAFTYQSWLDFPITEKNSVTRHIYEPELPYYFDPDYQIDYSFIVHGHTKDVPCAAPHFCHRFGYKPTDLMSPVFAKMFANKWKEQYERISMW